MSCIKLFLVILLTQLFACQKQSSVPELAPCVIRWDYTDDGVYLTITDQYFNNNKNENKIVAEKFLSKLEQLSKHTRLKVTSPFVLIGNSDNILFNHYPFVENKKQKDRLERILVDKEFNVTYYTSFDYLYQMD